VYVVREKLNEKRRKKGRGTRMDKEDGRETKRTTLKWKRGAPQQGLLAQELLDLWWGLERRGLRKIRPLCLLDCHVLACRATRFLSEIARVVSEETRMICRCE